MKVSELIEMLQQTHQDVEIFATGASGLEDTVGVSGLWCEKGRIILVVRGRVFKSSEGTRTF